MLDEKTEGVRVLREKIEGFGRVLEENREFNGRIQELKLENRGIEDRIEEIFSSEGKIDRLNKEIEMAKRSLDIFRKDRVEINDELDLIDMKMNNLRILKAEVEDKVRKKLLKLGKIQAELTSSKEYEVELVEKLAFHITQEAEKANQLIKCKSTLAEAKSAFHKFNIRRIWMMSSTPATLSINKTADFLYNLNIEDSEKVKTLKFDEIDSVFLHPAKSNHFFIKLNKESNQEYFCEDSEKVVELIRELLLKTILRN